MQDAPWHVPLLLLSAAIVCGTAAYLLRRLRSLDVAEDGGTRRGPSSRAGKVGARARTRQDALLLTGAQGAAEAEDALPLRSVICVLAVACSPARALPAHCPRNAPTRVAAGPAR
jgi:hypothetical protein